MKPWVRGAMGELLVCVDLLDHGYEVFRGVAGTESCDLIAYKDGKFVRVQVKAGLYEPKIDPAKQDVVAAVDLGVNVIEYIPPLPEVGITKMTMIPEIHRLPELAGPWLKKRMPFNFGKKS